MSSMLPVAVYGLKVPAGDVMVPAMVDFPATFHITMAAIDPNEAPEHTGTANGETPPRATLKIIYEPMAPNDDEDDASKEEYLRALLGAPDDDDDEDDDDEESSDDDEEKNGGPSDPSKTKKARKEAAAMQILQALQGGVDESDEDMEDASKPKINGVLPKSNKGKGKAVVGSEESSDEEDEADEEVKELVLCTLDPNQHYQQTLDITIPEDQKAYFKVSGTHAVYLTGNYVIPPDGGHSHDDEEDPEAYDMSPDEDELEGDEDESDDLDDIEDPRITEVDSEEEAPKLIKSEKSEPAQKGKNKRAAEESDEEPATLDAIMDKSLKPAQTAPADQPKLSKKQLKKLKNNAGNAVEAAVETKDVKKVEDSSPPKGDKKVQFAKNLEQGPSGASTKSSKEAKHESKADAKPAKQDNVKPKAGLGMKTLQDGVAIDDRKLGSGPAAKKGDKVGLRYIGKLENGKVFDANKKGAPFKFTIGRGEVIKGWDIGIAGMTVGGERRVNIPAKMAYGGKAQAGIPANSPLQFDVKLLQIN